MTDTALQTTPLHRHQLARLTRDGWDGVRRREWDATAGECLGHWAGNGLPLVVTRQPGEDSRRDTIALGLPAPARWDRRRIAIDVPRSEVSCFDEFPRVEQVGTLLRDPVRADWQRLCASLKTCGATARVYGSFGWQHITGLDHLRPDSDIDVWIAVSRADQADAVAAQLQAFPNTQPRLDGELVFDDGTAVAWREWLAWRAGRAKGLLVKRIDGSALLREACRRRDAATPEATP
jgi:phosphoribosyl-dephospho-CoA transferase